MIRLCSIVLLLAVFAPAAPVYAHIPAKEGVRSAPRKARTAILQDSAAMRRIVAWQRDLHRRISRLVRAQRDDMSPGVFLLLVGLAGLYGIIHAFGPGHGKIIIASCVVGRTYRIRDILKAAAVFTGVHNGSAVLLYTGFVLATGSLRRRTTHEITTAMYGISGWLLVLLGVIMLVAVLWKRHDHTHELSRRVSRMSLPLATALAGLVPCPGTLVMLLFSGSLGLVWLGYTLALSFAAGMFITLSLIALLIASGRNLAVRPLKSVRTVTVLRITGAVLLMVLGLYVVLLY